VLLLAQTPRMEAFEGAVLVADITGFTALTEDLGRQGPAGVEMLTRCMNNFFSLVIHTVRGRPAPSAPCMHQQESQGDAP
jgi:hypothetical protein